MNKTQLENGIRNEVLSVIVAALRDHFQTDVEPVSTNSIMMPALDAENNEKFAVISVTIPRGTRTDGTYVPYDGYAAAEDYRIDCEEKAAKVKAREEKNRRAEEAKEQKRKARKVVKELNTVGFKALVTKPIDEDE